MDSKILLGLTFWKDIDFSAVFKDEDLTALGIEKDPHITILEGDKFPREELIGTIKILIGSDDWGKLMDILKEHEPEKVLDHFSLGSVTDEEGREKVVLYLQPESPYYDMLQILRTGLKERYGDNEEDEYKPYLTLANLRRGRSKGYVFNQVLGMVLENSSFALDDFILWEGEKKYQITTENAVDRFFRQLRSEEGKDFPY